MFYVEREREERERERESESERERERGGERGRESLFLLPSQKVLQCIPMRTSRSSLMLMGTEWYR